MKGRRKLVPALGGIGASLVLLLHRLVHVTQRTVLHNPMSPKRSNAGRAAPGNGGCEVSLLSSRRHEAKHIDLQRNSYFEW